ncbi:MAG: DUF4442 domain-containing protein [Flavobacteriaceae bacterium]|nr:DUF4442 domain-containing protein [Flavobacteriaceae bacterium]
MKFTPSKLNTFTFFKLPSVWWCGIRVTKIENIFCEVKVVHRWINQNPFKSMFWAVQGMAAELTTGVLIMQAIKNSKRKISMLVLNNRANFSKKAKGKILFECNENQILSKAMNQLLETQVPQTIWLTSKGVDQNGDIVSTFEFEWTLLLKN